MPDGHRDTPRSRELWHSSGLFPAVQLFAARAGDAGVRVTEVNMAAVMGIDSDDDRR